MEERKLEKKKMGEKGGIRGIYTATFFRGGKVPGDGQHCQGRSWPALFVTQLHGIWSHDGPRRKKH